jgi:hypothetical protein
MIRSAFFLAALAALAGCASAPPPVQLSETWPTQAGDYRDVTDKWTRHARKRSGPDAEQGRIVDQTLDVVATFKSPEWRAAYVKYRAEQNMLPPGEVAALTKTEQSENADHYEVMLLVATYDQRLNELQKGKRSVWRLALVDASGAELIAKEVRRDRRPRTEIAADFPHLTDFHEPYIAVFPRVDEKGARVDLLRPDARRFSLKMTSSQVGVELIWAEPDSAR